MTNKNNTTILNTETPKNAWGLKHGDTCWNVFISGEYFKVIPATFNENTRVLRMLGLVHLTQEQADRHARVLNTGLAIKKWKRENDDVEFDWNNGKQLKYYFVSDVKRLYTDYSYTAKLNNTIYFSSEPEAQQCIDDIGEERIIEWLEWEDNDK